MKLIDVEHIFFDLDHTLWDFDRNSALAFEQMFIRRKIPVKTDDFLKVYIPVNFRYWELFRQDKVTKEELRFGRLKDSFDLLKFHTTADVINSLSIEYIDFLPNNNHLLEGSLEILDYLKPNYQLHIITNGFEEVQHKKLFNSKILDYFTTVTTSEEAGVKKPHPFIFETALRKSEALAEKSVMVGDNFEADILGAQRSGIMPIFFDYYKKPEKIDVMHIKTLNELRNYF